MTERREENHDGVYVPPLPEDVEPHGSRDNAVEMGEGGKVARETLERQREKMARGERAMHDPVPDHAQTGRSGQSAVGYDASAGGNAEARADLGRTDNPRGTGIGYGGVGSASYGTQGAVGSPETLEEMASSTREESAMSTGNTNRPGNSETGAQGSTQRPPQTHQQSTAGQQAGGSGQTAKQSAGSVPPTQGTGSTVQDQGAGSGTNRTATTSGTTQLHNTGSAAQSGSTGSGAQGQSTTAQTKDKASDVKNQAQDKAGEIKDQAQGKASDVKAQVEDKASDVTDQAQSKLGDVKDQVQGKIGAVTSQAQDTLESVKANLQTKTDQLKGTVNEKTDQLVGAVNEKGGQAKQAADTTTTQAGEKLTGLAETLRDKSQSLPQDNPVASVATKAADTLQQTGAYLQESSPDDWVTDVKHVIERKPIESVLLAAGLGYMIARAFRK